MSESDVRDNVALVLNALASMKDLETTLKNSHGGMNYEATQKARDKLEDTREEVVSAGLAVLTQFLVDVHNTASALDRIASHMEQQT